MEDLFVWPRAREYDRTRPAGFEDEDPDFVERREEGCLDLQVFPNDRLHRVVVVAGPGYGKSALLTAIAGELAEGPLVPVSIPLASLASADSSIISFLSSSINMELDLSADWQRLAEQGLLVLLLDGLDEVPSGARPKLLRRIELFSGRYPRASWMLTVRDPGVVTGLGEAVLVELLPLDDEDIERFARACLHKDDCFWGKVRRSATDGEGQGNQGDGTHGGAVRADRAAAPEAAGQCQAVEHHGAERDPPRGGARLQVARPAVAVRALAHGLHAHVPVDAEGDPGPGAGASAGGAGGSRGRVRAGARQHQREGASGRCGGAKKNGPQAIGKSRGGWNTKLHMVSSDDRTAVAFALSPGNAHDAPEGRKLLEGMGKLPAAPAPGGAAPAVVAGTALVMDKAYEDDATRALARNLGFEPVVPPKSNRTEPWEYDRELYKRRNEVERLFRRLKGFRRVFTRYDKLDRMFLGFVVFALIVETLRHVA